MQNRKDFPMDRIPSQAAYEQNELAAARRHEQEVDGSPLAERKENQANFLWAMRERPDIVAEQVDWLLEGNYGYGAKLMAFQATSRMNRPALFTQLIAVYEWMCPRRMAVDAWKKLSAGEKARLQAAVESVIANHDQMVATGDR
jgi:hypothetical protein